MAKKRTIIYPMALLLRGYVMKSIMSFIKVGLASLLISGCAATVSTGYYPYTYSYPTPYYVNYYPSYYSYPYPYYPYNPYYTVYYYHGYRYYHPHYHHYR